MSFDLHKSPPSAPPPYTEYPQVPPQMPYGFTANVGPPTPGFQQPGQPGPGYGQPGYGMMQPGYGPPPAGYPTTPPVHTVYNVIKPDQPQPVSVQPHANNTSVVVLGGGCPACRIGTLENDFTCLGILCAIVFFPIGILCCMAMKEKRCTNCHATF